MVHGPLSSESNERIKMQNSEPHSDLLNQFSGIQESVVFLKCRSFQCTLKLGIACSQNLLCHIGGHQREVAPRTHCLSVSSFRKAFFALNIPLSLVDLFSVQIAPGWGWQIKSITFEYEFIYQLNSHGIGRMPNLRGKKQKSRNK